MNNNLEGTELTIVSPIYLLQSPVDRYNVYRLMNEAGRIYFSIDRYGLGSEHNDEQNTEKLLFELKPGTKILLKQYLIDKGCYKIKIIGYNQEVPLISDVLLSYATHLDKTDSGEDYLESDEYYLSDELAEEVDILEDVEIEFDDGSEDILEADSINFTRAVDLNREINQLIDDYIEEKLEENYGEYPPYHDFVKGIEDKLKTYLSKLEEFKETLLTEGVNLEAIKKTLECGVYDQILYFTINAILSDVMLDHHQLSDPDRYLKTLAFRYLKIAGVDLEFLESLPENEILDLIRKFK